MLASSYSSKYVSGIIRSVISWGLVPGRRLGKLRKGSNFEHVSGVRLHCSFSIKVMSANKPYNCPGPGPGLFSNGSFLRKGNILNNFFFIFFLIKLKNFKNKNQRLCFMASTCLFLKMGYYRKTLISVPKDIALAANQNHTNQEFTRDVFKIALFFTYLISSCCPFSIVSLTHNRSLEIKIIFCLIVFFSFL